MLPCKPIDIQDFESETLRPYLEEFATVDQFKFGLDKPVVIPDSKQWEGAMAMYTLNQYGAIGPGKMLCGIGAGTEVTTYLLARRGCMVVPTDRYLEDTPWSDVAPKGYAVDPSFYTNLPYPRENVVPVHADARALRLPSDMFDGVYSSGSIEHFGSIDAIESAAGQIGRILKPGGYASIATEFWLGGPEDRPWFDDNCILFTPELINKHIVAASGLELVNPIPARPSQETFESRRVLLDFLSKVVNVKTIEDKKAIYPNLVLYHEGFLFCSVHMLLRKPENWVMPKRSQELADYFAHEVHAQNQRAIMSFQKKPAEAAAAIQQANAPVPPPSGLLHRVIRKAFTEFSKHPKLVEAVRKVLFKMPFLHELARKLVRRARSA